MLSFLEWLIKAKNLSALLKIKMRELKGKERLRLNVFLLVRVSESKITGTKIEWQKVFFQLSICVCISKSVHSFIRSNRNQPTNMLNKKELWCISLISKGLPIYLEEKKVSRKVVYRWRYRITFGRANERQTNCKSMWNTRNNIWVSFVAAAISLHKSILPTLPFKVKACQILKGKWVKRWERVETNLAITKRCTNTAHGERSSQWVRKEGKGTSKKTSLSM